MDRGPRERREIAESAAACTAYLIEKYGDIDGTDPADSAIAAERLYDGWTSAPTATDDLPLEG